MNCYNCNAYIRRNAQYCSFCGQPTSPNALLQKYQPTSQMSGNPWSNGYKQQTFMSLQTPGGYMSQHPMQARPICQVSRRKRGIMLFLWLFTGLVGGHQFYTGHIGKGLLYLTTLGVSGVGWLLDFFGIIFGNPVDRDGMPIKW